MLMTNRRKNQAQAAVINRRSKGGTGNSIPALRLVQRSVVSAASQQMSNIKPRLLRSIDFHPAITILTAVAIIAAVCIIYLSQVTAVADANYTLQALQSHHTDLQRTHDDLMLQIGKAQSETTIESKARNDLKMVPVGNNYSYLPLLPGPLSNLPTAPTAALPTPADGP
jgi:cell division protein FtsB